MARDISIAYTVRDSYTQSVNTMRNANQRFNKDLEETGRQLQDFEKREKALGDGLVKSQVKLLENSKALKTAKIAHEEFNNELSRTNLEKAQSEYNKTKQEIKDWGDAIRDTRKEIKGLEEDQMRASNRAGGSDGGIGGMASALAKAGLGKMLGDSISGAVNVGIGSAFGDNVGSAISTTLSGALTGAAMGSIIPGIGTAVGAAVGAAAGGISAAAQYFGKQDDAFKSSVQEQVDNQLQNQAASLESGMSIQASRETGLRQLQTLFGGNESDAESFNKALIEIGRTPPFSYDTALGLSRQMLGLGLSREDTLDRINSLATAAAPLGLENVSSILSQLENVQLSGNLEARVFKTLVRSGINPYEAIAENFEFNNKRLSAEEVAEKLKDTKNVEALDPEEFVDAIYRYMGSRFEDGATRMEGTYSGLSGILSSYQEDMDAAMGKGFEDERKKGITSQIDYLSGDSGDKMQEANSLIGQWKASLENQREELMRQHESEALERIERDGLEGAEAGKVLAEARIKAQAEYNASDGAQLELESQRSLIASTRDMLVEDKTYWNAGYILGQEYSKGMAASLKDHLPDVMSSIAENYASGPYSAISPSLEAGMMRASPSVPDVRSPNKAFGMYRIPSDDYPIRAHQGERLLTAAEARAQDKSTAPFTITGNNITIREEADLYKFAQYVADEIKKAQLVS